MEFGPWFLPRFPVVFSPQRVFFLAGFFWPPYNRSGIFVSGCPALLILSCYRVEMSVPYTLYRVCKVLLYTRIACGA